MLVAFSDTVFLKIITSQMYISSFSDRSIHLGVNRHLDVFARISLLGMLRRLSSFKQNTITADLSKEIFQRSEALFQKLTLAASTSTSATPDTCTQKNYCDCYSYYK